MSSPNPDPGVNVLYGASAISSNDVWAVGSYAGNSLTEYWNGSQWTHVSSPNRPTEDHLFAVTAVSSNDVWAVGWSHSQGNGWLTLTEHWDGQQWSIVPSPNQPGSTIDNYLQGVSATSTDDVWTVGYYVSNSGVEQTLTEHWDGVQWSIVPSPDIGTENNILNSVSAISSNDAWAVGHYNYNDYNDEFTLVEHWDGGSWSVVSSPNPPGASGSALYSISATSGTSGNDVWAAGNYGLNPDGADTLIEHWDGSQWSIVPSPNLDQGTNLLYGVAAITSEDVWAAGYYVGNYGATLIEHWDGQQWAIVPSPSPGNDNLLYAMAAVSSIDVWAVGWWDACFACANYTLTEHYTGACPSSGHDFLSLRRDRLLARCISGLPLWGPTGGRVCATAQQALLLARQ